MVDRIAVSHGDRDNTSRIADSVQTAFYEGFGEAMVKVYDGNEASTYSFSNRFEADGITFEEPSENLFAFNNPVGACPTCEGFGSVIGIDEDLVVPDKSLSVYEDAIACWKGEKLSEWKNLLIQNAHKFGFPVHTPYGELTEEQRQLLWDGNRYFHGINDFLSISRRNCTRFRIE